MPEHDDEWELFDEPVEIIDCTTFHESHNVLNGQHRYQAIKAAAEAKAAETDGE